VRRQNKYNKRPREVFSCLSAERSTCSIGLHHVHHMRPGIPNYRLRECYEAIPELREVEPITIRTSLESLRLNLYDEQQRRMVSFSSLKG